MADRSCHLRRVHAPDEAGAGRAFLGRAADVDPQAELIQDVSYSKNGLAHYWSAETENSKICEMLC